MVLDYRAAAKVPTWHRPFTTSDESAVLHGAWFDIKAADRVRQFFTKFLRHSKGEFVKKAFELLEWQWEEFVAPVYGWRRADGTRRFRRVYNEVPKKNGKSTLCAGLSLYALVGDNEAGAEVYSAANDRDQASIVYNEAATMVEASPALSDRIEVLRSTKRLVFPKTNSVYKALSADVRTKEGLNIHTLIFDELHAQKTREMWDTLKYGGAARRQPLSISITTAGSDQLSICWEQHTYADNILKGVHIDEEFYPLIYGAEAKDDWRKEETWRKANPSYGIIIKASDMKSTAEEAERIPTVTNSFLRYRLNIWTEQEERYLSMFEWDLCSQGPFALETLYGEECIGGLDLSSTIDLTSFCAWFPNSKKAWWMFWAPESADNTRAKSQRTRLRPWIDLGFIKETPGEVVDYDIVRQDILEFSETCDMRELAIDRWNSTQLQTQLMGDGIEVVQFGQGFASMTAPTKDLEKLVIAHELDHGRNPIARWMAANLAVERDAADNRKPSKKKAGDKIDGMVALIMCLGRANVIEPKKQSVYERRGIATM